MPCRVDEDWDTTPRRVERHGMELADFEAALCGVFTAIERWGNDTTLEGRLKQMLDKVDWDDAGVRRKTVETWWKKHKKEDEERRAREAAARRKEELKAAAISKLSMEERAALGLL